MKRALIAHASLIGLLLPLPVLAEMVHPLCLDRLQGSLEEPANSSEPTTLDLAECEKKFRETPFEKRSEYSAVYQRTVSQESEDSRLPAFVDYDIIGQLENHQSVIRVSSNYGGTMTQSNVLVVSGLLPGGNPDRRIIRNQEITGGDRCFGGITKVSILSPDTIEIERNITTDDLLQLNQDTSKPLEGVSGCAICCIGVRREKHQIGKPGELVQIELNRQLSANDYAWKQGCFNKLTGKLSKDHPLILDSQALQQLQQSFDQECKEKF